MPVCRLIFRLDFKANFKIIDHPGEVMRIIHAAGNEFLPRLSENQQVRTISGVFSSKEKTIFRSLSVEPNAIYGIIETVNGIEIKSLENDHNFSGLIKIAGTICKEFGIKEIARSGLRLFFFKKLYTNDKQMHSAFRRLYDGHIVQSLEKILGNIDDYRIAFDGQHEEKIHYHFNCGPYRSDEAGKYLVEIADEFKQQVNYDFIADLDLFEKDFELSAVLTKWYLPLFRQAEQTYDTLEKNLLEKFSDNGVPTK